MNRTVFLFSLAAALGLIGIAIGIVPMVKVRAPLPPTIVEAPPLQRSADGLVRLTAGLSDPFVALGAEREVFMKIGLEARDVAGRPSRIPVNVAMVLDRSGSMAGEKLEHAKSAARALVNRLGETDRFALITFGSDVTVAYASSPVTPAARDSMLAAIDSIQDVGGTNLSGGIEAGVAQVRANASRYGVNRVILCSDGQANEGVVETEPLLAMSRHFADEGVKLSTIGLGLDFNEDVMMGLASHGDGRYHYLRDPDQLESIFVGEFNRATQAVASNVELTLAPQPGVRIEQIIGYPSQSMGVSSSIRVPDLSSGERLKVVVKLGVLPSHPGNIDIAQVGLHYINIPGGQIAESAKVELAASVTRDERFALGNRDRAVLEDATKAESGFAYMQAAKYLRDGENAKALDLLRGARRVVETRNAFVKSADLSKFERMFDSEEKEVARPLSADDLSNKIKSMSAFGNQAAQE